MVGRTVFPDSAREKPHPTQFTGTWFRREDPRFWSNGAGGCLITPLPIPPYRQGKKGLGFSRMGSQPWGTGGKEMTDREILPAVAFWERPEVATPVQTVADEEER